MKEYFSWIGANATTGTPNKNTGRMSMYGEIRKFYSKKALDDYCSNFDSRFNDYPRPASRKFLRTKCLGMPVRDFNEYLDYLV